MRAGVLLQRLRKKLSGRISLLVLPAMAPGPIHGSAWEYPEFRLRNLKLRRLCSYCDCFAFLL